MNTVARAMSAMTLAVCAWPELGRYRGEWMLAEANAGVAAAFNGTLGGAAAVAAVQSALTQAQHAADELPGDQRPALASAIALLLLHRGAEAATILEATIAAGERPELTLNLGRARGISGDEAGAQAAFLRTAWASPPAVATLPAAMRAPLLERIKQLEGDLRAGRLRDAPPL